VLEGELVGGARGWAGLIGREVQRGDLREELLERGGEDAHGRGGHLAGSSPWARRGVQTREVRKGEALPQELSRSKSLVLYSFFFFFYEKLLKKQFQTEGLLRPLQRMDIIYWHYYCAWSFGIGDQNPIQAGFAWNLIWLVICDVFL